MPDIKAGEPYLAVCPPAPPGYQPGFANATNGDHADTNGFHAEQKASEILAEIAQRRAAAGKFVAGIAAATDSDMYKGPVCLTYTALFSHTGLTRITARWKAQSQTLGQ